MIHIRRSRFALSTIGLVVFIYGVGVLTSPLVLAMDTDRWSVEARIRWLVMGVGVMALGAAFLVVANRPRLRSEKGRPVRCPKCRHTTNDRLAACPECGSPVWDNVEKRAGGWRLGEWRWVAGGWHIKFLSGYAQVGGVKMGVGEIGRAHV